MKQHWENIGEEMHSFKEGLETLLDMLPQSAKIHKQVNVLNRAWKRVQKAVNDMDPFITPVKSIEVKSPLLADAEFKATWKFWKDYLMEQHGITMHSRMELKALKRMMDISEDNPKNAVEYLDYAMYRGSQHFYKVNETELPKNNKPENGGIKIALPAQYVNTTNKTHTPPSPAIKQKTLEEEIKEFKQQKRRKS